MPTPRYYNDDDRHPPGENLPGFDYGTSIVGAWMQGASDQSAIVNDMWQRLSRGRYGVEQWLQGLSRMWQSYVSTVDNLLRSPPWSAPGPGWVNFVYDAKEATALKRTVELARPLDPTVKFDVTSLRALGDPAGRIMSRHVTVIRRNRHDNRTLVVAIDQKALERQPPGQYMGFVLDPRTSGEPPLLVDLAPDC